MLKNIFWTFVLITSALTAWECPENHPAENYDKPAYDSDLFNKCQKTFFFNGEFLYWKVQENPTDYALKMTNPPRNGSSNLLASGDFERATFDWRPGYRILLGFFNAPKYWDITAQYTWIYSKGVNSVNRNSQNLFINGTFLQFLTNPIEHSDSKIQLHYHLGNLLFDRVFIPNPHLRLKLYGGITGAFFTQKWKVRYLDIISNTTTVTNNWTFDSVGFRTGLSFDWFWRKDFYMSGRITFASVIGKYKNKSTLITTEGLTNSDNINSPLGNTLFEDYRVSLNTQMVVGPSYQKDFSKRRLEIFAGYELNAWTNLFEVFRSTQSSASQAKQTLINKGLLAFQGLTLKLHLDF